LNPFANFIGVLEDLDKGSREFDQYHLMRIPGMLRLLLLDALLDQVNREFRQRIRFRVGGTLSPRIGPDGNPVESELLFASVGDSFDPDHLAGIKVHESYKPPRVREVGRDELLKLYVLCANGHYFTIKDLIDNLAYVQGLTHPGPAKTESDQALLGWRQTLQLGDVGAGLREMRSVGRVVHNGLVPLRDAVLQKYSPTA
jgi:hypothetical protein